MADAGVTDPYRQPPGPEIAKALIAIQKILEPLVKSAVNDEYDSGYVPLEMVTPKAHKLLTQHNIAVMQPSTTDEEGRPAIETILVHESGEYFMRRTRLVLGDKANPQGHMSAITYMRRGSLMSTIGMTGRGEDDDGNKASGIFAPVTEEQKDRLRSLMKHLKYPKPAMANELFNIKTRDHAYIAIKNFEETVAMKARDDESKDNASEIEFGKKISVGDGRDAPEADTGEELEPLSHAALEKRIKALGLKDQGAENNFVFRMVNKAFLKNVKEPDDLKALDRAITMVETGMHALPGDFYPPADEPRVVEEDVA